MVGKALSCALGSALCVVLPILSALADRHCSFARQSAFYARDIAAEAMRAPNDACPAKMQEAAEHLSSAMIELEICSCAPAEAPLRQWYANRPPSGIDADASCPENATAINAAAGIVLTEVEKCF